MKTAKSHWDKLLRELTFQGKLVKDFSTGPASSQEAILDAFQEDGWRPRIDDPLTGPPGAKQQQRLHDAVCGLNKNQKNARIRFYRDGTGKGIKWQPGE